MPPVRIWLGTLEDTRAATPGQRASGTGTGYPVVMPKAGILLLLMPFMLPLSAVSQDPTGTPPEPAKASPRVRAPLVPEGTIVVNAEGIMVRDERKPLWRFHLVGDSADTKKRTRDFVLLPSHLLEEMEEKADSVAPEAARFNLTGEVFSYGRENWLLPQHVEWITSHSARNEATEEPADPSAGNSPPVDDPGSEEPPGPRDQGDSIADIVAELQQSVGPLRRSIDTGEDSTTELPGPSEGQILFSRRGRLGRGRTGAWVFVLDSDVSGLSDPSLILLPSRRLAALEHYAGHGWLGRPMLITGEVFTYRGRHFLQPSSWKFVRERPNLIR